ncbi:unnamed protein product, partial [Ectocarpus sp. 12 AP-2014]
RRFSRGPRRRRKHTTPCSAVTVHPSPAAATAAAPRVHPRPPRVRGRTDRRPVILAAALAAVGRRRRLDVPLVSLARSHPAAGNVNTSAVFPPPSIETRRHALGTAAVWPRPPCWDNPRRRHWTRIAVVLRARRRSTVAAAVVIIVTPPTCLLLLLRGGGDALVTIPRCPTPSRRRFVWEPVRVLVPLPRRRCRRRWNSGSNGVGGGAGGTVAVALATARVFRGRLVVVTLLLLDWPAV